MTAGIWIFIGVVIVSLVAWVCDGMKSIRDEYEGE